MLVCVFAQVYVVYIFQQEACYVSVSVCVSLLASLARVGPFHKKCNLHADKGGRIYASRAQHL